MIFFAIIFSAYCNFLFPTLSLNISIPCLIGTSTLSTNKEAQEALRIALNEYEICGSVVDESNITTIDYFDYWYKEYVLINCKYNTQEHYKRVIKNYIKLYLGVYKLKSLAPAILQEFINQKDLSELSKSSIDNFHRVLSGALKSSVYPYLFIKENPMQYVKLPKDNNLKRSKEDLKITSIKGFNKIINIFPYLFLIFAY